MDASSAPDYSQFLKTLKAAIPTYPLTVTVQPDYYYKGYDLKEIGALADTVILMAYDFTHNDSKLPSAPLPLVNDAVKRTLAFVPKESSCWGYPSKLINGSQQMGYLNCTIRRLRLLRNDWQRQELIRR